MVELLDKLTEIVKITSPRSSENSLKNRQKNVGGRIIINVLFFHWIVNALAVESNTNSNIGFTIIKTSSDLFQKSSFPTSRASDTIFSCVKSEHKNELRTSGIRAFRDHRAIFSMLNAQSLCSLKVQYPSKCWT